MANVLRVLMVEDSESDALQALAVLEGAGFRVTSKRVETRQGLVSALKEESWDLVISDYAANQLNGFEALNLVKQSGLDLPFIIVSGNNGEETAVELMKAGAHDYIIKSHLKRLIPAVQRELKECEQRQQRRKAEEELRQSEERYSTLVENSNDGIFILQDGVSKFVNSTVLKMTGYSAEEVINKPFLDYIAPDYRGLVWERYQKRVAEVETPNNYSIEIVTKDGRHMPIEITATRIEYRGKAADTVAIRDISERKQAEERIRQSEQFNRSLLENSPHPIIVINTDDSIRYVNPAFVKLTGFLPEEVTGSKPPFRYWPKDHLQIYSVDYKDPSLSSCERIFQKKNGETFWVELNANTVSERGEIIYHLVNWVDITDRKKADEALKESEEKYRLAFMTGLDASYLATLEDGLMLEVNNNFESVFGYSPKELAGKTSLQLGLYDNPTDRSRMVSEVKSKGYVKDMELQGRKKSGELITVSLSAGMILINNQKHIFGTIRDITDLKMAENHLKESQAQYQTLVDNANEAIVVAQDGLLKFVNRTTLELFKGSEQELISKPFTDFVHPDDRARMLENFWKRIHNVPLPQRNEYRLVSKDGAVRWADIGTALIDWKGKPATLNFITDITQRKQTEELLHEAEERYKLMFKSAPLAINITRGTEITYANPAYLKMFGISSLSDSKKFSALELFVPEARTLILENIQRRAKGLPVPDCYEVEILRTDGSRFPILMYLTRATFRDGPATVAFIEDITDRKKPEQSLIESETFNKELLQNAPNPVLATNPDRSIRYVNPAFERLTGFTLAELSGCKTPFPWWPAEDLKELEREVIAGQKKDLNTLDLRYIKKTGEIFWVKTNIRPVRHNGEIVYFLSNWTDVTDRKQAEEDRQRVAKLESIGILAGGIAHDFNNILTGILGNVQLADRYLKDNRIDQVPDLLGEAERASLRARDLTQQLLTFSRGGSPVKKPSVISDLVIETANFAARGSKSNCQFAIAQDLFVADIDSGQIGQVITNVIINADQAMPEGGTIRVAASNLELSEDNSLSLPPAKYVQISVEDHGIGIPEKYLSRIFEPYFTTKEKGHGLGLATAYSIVKNHGGKMTLKSKVGEGTTFYIYLPASTQTRLFAEVKKSEKATPVKGKGKILIMDDEEAIRKLLSIALKGAEYEVEVSKDGAEAIRHYRNAKDSGQPFDLVIMDLTIPGGMGGKEAVIQILQIDPAAKVIVSSGYSTDPIMAEYSKYGFSGVMVKPYNIKELEAAIAGWITNNR